MRFKIDEKVRFLHEEGEGKIVSFKNEKIAIVVDETGFNVEYLTEELVKIIGDQTGVVQQQTLNELDVITPNSGQQKMDCIKKSVNLWEVDLHSHQLLETEEGLSSHQILERQLYAFKDCFNQAQNSRVRKFIVIHGVGNGTLKSKVRHFLDGRMGVEYFDASYQEYGKGATEVRLKYR